MEAIDINNTFGAMLIGAHYDAFGGKLLQAYFYFITYPQDSHGMKSFVGLIWVLDTIHVLFMCHTMHHYLIAGFGNPAYLVEGTWSLFSSILINVMIASLVQCFFTQRIHELCPKPYRWWMTSVIGSMVFTHICFGLETVGQLKEFSRLNEVNYVAVLPFAITAIVSDLSIALGLCFLLQRSRTNSANTDHLIKILVRYAITRCLLTSLIAVVEVIAFVTKPTSFYSFAVDFVIGKLWSNSLLASLNSRRSLRDTFNRKSGTMSTGFRVASPGLNTTGAEPGQFNLVRIPRHDESKSTDEEISCTKISTQASRQSSELRFSGIDSRRTQ
ncbi:hypothetical protein EDD18DRAFT_829397 [Armillaria luteobubalina]|uniref:DUF6534 domain-containing protein n=1 Tax=Armillaria luteobubalina TaxID=153913 RepID=A0AA39QE81_9AGAR|nr:hypothetical protein EDD18DRAFT_829397 [Armillaria luteobubalina]